VALAAGVVWTVVGRSLRPVEQLLSEVEDISAHRLHRRVDVPPTRDEVGRLAATLNAMLDRLEDAHVEQRRFVADASHELRTPIANIRTAVEVAASNPGSADWPAVSVDLLRQDDRLQRLADDLLFLARSDLGATARRVETIDLAALVRTEMGRPVRDGVRLVLVEPLPAVTLDGDRDQLGRALSNLLDNALRHATSTVSVGLHAGTQRVQIVVRDDGPGIARDDRERIFDRFVRLDEGRARSDGGSGLGLAIVREIAQAHGGTVRVIDAEPGATLVLELPRPPVSQRSLSPRPPRSHP
jgi:signal transduction histidine kinase